MFVEKLNKKQDGSVYVIEEEQAVTDGKYEGYLEHDNINQKSIKAYTDTKLTGEEIINVIFSAPVDTPWKTYIKVFADVERVYITYETPGDQVEAEDINSLQEAEEQLRGELNEFKVSGHIDGGTF